MLGPPACARVLTPRHSGAGPPTCRGTIGTLTTVAREEGVAALWRGLVPGLHRQVLLGGVRIASYDPIRGAYARLMGEDAGHTSLPTKIAAGGRAAAAALQHDPPCVLRFLRCPCQTPTLARPMRPAALTAGTLGVLVGNPTDVLKVRMQASARQPGAPAAYPSGGAGAPPWAQRAAIVPPVLLFAWTQFFLFFLFFFQVPTRAPLPRLPSRSLQGLPNDCAAGGRQGAVDGNGEPGGGAADARDALCLVAAAAACPPSELRTMPGTMPSPRPLPSEPQHLPQQRCECRGAGDL